MKTLITFLIVFSVVVVIHEFGHFYFAKKSG
ncbi:MAG: site-2 protease family protein, partial [Tetragenococcus halophilus]|nr:site-2 protease family protein [Tetragenococcus halophilus]